MIDRLMVAFLQSIFLFFCVRPILVTFQTLFAADSGGNALLDPYVLVPQDSRTINRG